MDLKCFFGLFLCFFKCILVSTLVEFLSVTKDLSFLGIKQNRECNDGILVVQSHQSNIFEGI